MQIWVVEATEPLPAINPAARPLRCGMLIDAVLGAGHGVTWWSSTFDHASKRHHASGSTRLHPRAGLRLNLLAGPGYPANLSLQRVRHSRALARGFAVEALAEPEAPDLVFTCWPLPELAEQAVRYASARNIPVVVDARDQWPDIYTAAVPAPLRGAARLALSGEVRRAERTFGAATGITAVSHSYLRWALAYARRSRRPGDEVFPIGYPDSQVPPAAERAALRQRLRLPDGGVVATFCGVFGSTYDLGTLVDAARQLHDSAPALTIVLAGDGEQADALRKTSAACSNVRFTGWLDAAGVAGLLAISDIGVCAYAPGAPQSLPNKPFEYMQAGLAMVNSLPGELEALVRNEGIGISYRAGSAEDLVNALRCLALDDRKRREMGERARRLFVTRFRAPTVYGAFVTYLETCAARPATAGAPAQ